MRLPIQGCPCMRTTVDIGIYITLLVHRKDTCLVFGGHLVKAHAVTVQDIIEWAKFLYPVHQAIDEFTYLTLSINTVIGLVRCSIPWRGRTPIRWTGRLTQPCRQKTTDSRLHRRHHRKIHQEILPAATSTN